MNKAPHTSCHPGKRVRVTLRDGSEFVDRFKARTGQFVVFNGRRIEGRHIKQFIVLKGDQH